MSRSVQPTNYTRPEPPKPVEYRVEWCGNLQVHVPIKPRPAK